MGMGAVTWGPPFIAVHAVNITPSLVPAIQKEREARAKEYKIRDISNIENLSNRSCAESPVCPNLTETLGTLLLPFDR